MAHKPACSDLATGNYFRSSTRNVRVLYDAAALVQRPVRERAVLQVVVRGGRLYDSGVDDRSIVVEAIRTMANGT